MKNSINTETAPAYNAMSVNIKMAEEDKIIETAMAILKSRIKTYEFSFTQADSVVQYLGLKVARLEHEVFGCLFLNNQHQLIEDEILFTGTIDGASVYPREVARAALDHNAAAVIYYHNHPSGLNVASLADKAITSKLKQALGLLEIRTLDHIIIAGNEFVSFAQTGQI